MKEKEKTKVKIKRSSFVLTAIITVPVFFLIGLLLGDLVVGIEGIKPLGETMLILIKYAIGLAFAIVGFALAAPIYLFLSFLSRKVERSLEKYSSKEILMGMIGLVLGVLLAVLIALLIDIPTKTDGTRVIINVCVGILLGYLGMRIGSRILYDVLPATNMPRPAKLTTTANPNAIVLDSSSLIDGRVLDIVRTGFLTGLIIIPNDVLLELGRIADHTEELKRNRGRRGLDIVTGLQKEKNITVSVVQLPVQAKDPDEAVVKAALDAKARIMTGDYNLGKLAMAQKIEVLNINDLANAIKPIALPGERMTVKIVKRGKEAGQGVAYAPDGTMIVVENGAASLGNEEEVLVTTSLQTSSGRIIFTRIEE